MADGSGDKDFDKSLEKLRSGNKKAALWFGKAYEHGRRTMGWFAVKDGSPEDKAWREYFAKLGWTPMVVRTVSQSGERSYTMPVQWPTWLPVGFSEGLV